MEFPADVLERFWAKTTTDHDFLFNASPCVIWTGAIYNPQDTNKYGRFTTVAGDGKHRWWLAHRFAYTAAHGEIEPGLEVDHLCRRTLCVADRHLEAVTGCENRRRAELYRIHQLMCPAGHLRVRGGVKIRRNGSLVCRQCVRDNTAEYMVELERAPKPARPLADLSPRCRNNHVRTIANTGFTRHGLVRCRDCAREATERWMAKKARA